MYSLDANTGNEVWEFAVPDPIVRAAVVLGSGDVYFMTDGGEFYGLDKNKNKLWDPPGSTDRVAGSPILNISNGLVFTSAYHTLYLLNPNSHTEAVLFDAGGFIEDPSFGPNGLVVAGSLDNTLYAFR
jgi:outer membrane protein assembly factor BamB